MRNRYEKRCCFCKETIPVNGGRIWKWKSRWYGAHDGCKSKTEHRGLAAPASVEAAPALAEPSPAELRGLPVADEAAANAEAA
jgi:hypothetical protein